MTLGLGADGLDGLLGGGAAFLVRMATTEGSSSTMPRHANVEIRVLAVPRSMARSLEK
jgi:hypothetical protein